MTTDLTIPERLSRVRDQLQSRGWAAFIDTGTDPHDSEYPPSRWETRRRLTGFTGSAGTVVVTPQSAGLWTDGRYFTQAEQELAETRVTLFREGLVGVPTLPEWLAQTLPPGSVVGVDGTTLSVQKYRQWEADLRDRGLRLQAATWDWAPLWPQRPSVPAQPIEDFQSQVPGLAPRATKLATLRADLAAASADAGVFSALDDIAWVLNLRGADVAFTPVFMAWLWIDPQRAVLFASIDPGLAHRLADDGIECRPYDDGPRFFEAVPPTLKVLVSPDRLNVDLWNKLGQASRVEATSPITRRKLRKSAAELDAIREAHRRDGAALVEFLAEFSQGAELLTERQAAQRLDEYRARQGGYRGPSFAAIPGFGEHGAIIHYHPEGEGAVLGERGLFLLDTGAQYNDGTTDVTRTLSRGEPTRDEIVDYTLILRAHLAVAMTPFPPGTRGYMLDAQARGILWRHGRQYLHGTGHGVGHVLGVHEGPVRLNSEPLPTVLAPGMVLSNEPGLYRPGRYGIRIENLVVCVERPDTEFGSFLGWESLTLCPYERALIDATLLTDDERAFVDSYHKTVRDELWERVSDSARAWLAAACEPLTNSGQPGPG